MVNLAKYTKELKQSDGIYFAHNQTEVSYPKEGNSHFFQIEENSFWFKHRNDCIVEVVKKYSGDSVFFDIGGGNGYVAKGLEDRGIETVLIEPGITGCLNAKKRNLKSIVCSTLENACFHKGVISAAGMFDVVEHIENDSLFLSSIYEYIEDNGYVYITVPAYNVLWSNEDKDAGHYRRYTIKQLEDKLKAVGFKIQYSTYIFSILPFPVLFFRTLPSKLGFNKRSSEIDKHKKEHNTSGNFVSKILNKLWSFELNRIKHGKKIPLGGSCFVVARKSI
jgi:2-polyprenyl-3-methyl-5-hydroxy-6-metoxy-1,4-benzoquinol methylase